MTPTRIANQIIKAFKRGNKLLIIGNGGSAAQAQHISSELIGRFDRKRKALPALALTTDTSVLTSIANDYHFNYVFKRQVQAFGKKGDVLLILTTSGLSKNCILAAKTAKQMGMIVIELSRLGRKTSAIQENHLRSIHKICDKVEKAFT